MLCIKFFKWHCPVFCRQARLCGGKTLFCFLLQPEESEGSVRLSRSGSEGTSEGASKGHIMSDPHETALAKNVFSHVFCFYMYNQSHH